MLHAAGAIAILAIGGTWHAAVVSARITSVGTGDLAPNDPIAAINSLPLATTTIDEAGSRLTIALPLVEVPAHGMARTPVYRAAVPIDISVYRFTAEVLDETGAIVHKDRLHHFIMTDATRRELFLPLAMPIFGASKESPNVSVPRTLFGVPLPSSGKYIATAMLANPEDRPRQLQVRLTLAFGRRGRVFPLFEVYPWTMDVKFPLGGEGGRHDFDIPVGRSSFSWEGSPYTSGRIIGMGGHAHDYVTSIQLTDMTTGDTIWHQTPVLAATGRLSAIPAARFFRWHRLGVRIVPSHTYRVTVAYDNPTGHILPYGGMGSVIGLIVPDRKTWPAANRMDPLFQAQISNLLNNMSGFEMIDHEHTGSTAAHQQ